MNPGNARPFLIIHSSFFIIHYSLFIIHSSFFIYKGKVTLPAPARVDI